MVGNRVRLDIAALAQSKILNPAPRRVERVMDGHPRELVRLIEVRLLAARLVPHALRMPVQGRPANRLRKANTGMRFPVRRNPPVVRNSPRPVQP